MIVHYAGAGRKGLVFECYLEALQVVKYGTPLPLKSTSLDQVTCRDCWREIRNMAT